MEVKFRALTYEGARAEHFEALKNKAERKMTLWAARSDRSSPYNLADPAYIKASEFGKEYNFYKDALDALAAAPKWISVEERLPDIENENGTAKCTETVIGVDKLGYQYVGFFRVYKYDNSFEFVGCDCNGFDRGKFDVTHWMPLPEPPKEEE